MGFFALPYPLSPSLNPAAGALDCATAALRRYAQFLRDDAGNVLPTIALYTKTYIAHEHQEIEQSLQDLAYYSVIDRAFGQLLVNLGNIVGQQRAGNTDAIFRKYVRAKIRVNLSNGTTEDILSILFLIVKPITVTLVNYYPAAFIVTINGAVDDATAMALVSFVKAAKSAGINGILEWYESATPFTFDIGPGFDQSNMAGAQ
jgi:hypothetical protein